MKGERTCIGCRAKAGKSSLYRIVRRPDGAVELDVSSRAPGRGAYVCSRACFEKVVENGRLASALRTKLDAGVYDALVASPLWAVATGKHGEE